MRVRTASTKVTEAEFAELDAFVQRGADAWTSYSVIRMRVIGQDIEGIMNYIHCPWMIQAATSISLVGGREMRD